MGSKIRALITGASGFIGSHLQDYLEGRGYEIIGLDNLKWSTRQMKNLVIGDVLDQPLVGFLVQQVDEVFHLAAQISVPYSNEHPQQTLDINIQGTLNILEACRKYGKKLIYASTSEVYGTSQTDSISESHQLDGQSVYAASKIAGDRLCKAYYDTHGVDTRILRNFNTFGSYQRFDGYGGAIAIFTDRALHHKSPIIFGDGNQERDYMDVLDAVRGYELITTSGEPGQPLNIGTGRTVTINEIAELICEYTGCPQPIHTEPRAGEVRRLCADITRAKGLGFIPLTNFEKSLHSYIDWKKSFLRGTGHQPTA